MACKTVVEMILETDKFGNRKIGQRKDDNVETIKNRLKVYRNQTQPLLEYYKKKRLITEVEGDLDVDSLFEKLKILFNDKKLI